MKTALWTDLIRIELDAMGEDDLIEPQGEPESGEEEVGTVDMDLRKLYTRAQQTQAETLRFAADDRCARNSQERVKAVEKAQETAKKAEIYMELFWIALRDEFKLWGGWSIGIRKGWKAVKSKPDGPPSLPDLLRGMFGS